MNLEITWLQDDYDCEDCGFSSAEGASVTLDGKDFLLLDPLAHCFGGASWDEAEVYKAILEKLGFTFTFDNSF